MAQKTYVVTGGAAFRDHEPGAKFTVGKTDAGLETALATGVIVEASPEEAEPQSRGAAETEQASVPPAKPEASGKHKG